MKKVQELGSTNRVVQNSHGDVKYSVGNIVNILVTVHGVMGMRFIRMIT